MASSTAVAAGDDMVGSRNLQGGCNGGGGGATPPPSQQQPQPLPPPPEQGLRCPRCDSPNTKFCYYNNYSISQPRYFCKTCRRYWTKGGALRSVPVGGGCRKNKRSRSAASASAAANAASSSRLTLNLPVEGIGAADQQAAARLGFHGGGAPVATSSPIGDTTPADYQGAAAFGMMALPCVHTPAFGHYVAPFEEWQISSSGPGADITGGGGSGNGIHTMNGEHTAAGAVSSSSIASSIESLSFINQDLHWKLQQQRLASMFLGPPPTSGGAAVVHVEGAGSSEHTGGSFLQMTSEAPGMETVPAATSWFMDSSYVFPSRPPPAANNNSVAALVTTTNGNVDNSGYQLSSANDDGNATSNSNCGSALPSWGDMSTLAMLPP